MITIDYQIINCQPLEDGEDAQNILSINKAKVLEFHSGQGSITIQFPKTKIEEITLCLGSSASVQIGAFNSPDQTDMVYLIESQESVVGALEKTIKYSSNLFASHKDTKFSYAKLDISSTSSNGSLKIFYWILKSPRDSGSSPPRSNHMTVNSRSFYSSPPAKRTLEISKNPKTDLSNSIQRFDLKQSAFDEIPRKRKIDYDTPRASRNPIDNRIGINNKIRSENKKQEDKTINIEDGETIAEQNSIFQDIQNRKQRVLRSHTQKKEPTNSYKNVLNNCLVSSAVQDPGKSIIISELCESLGAIYIEELDRSVEYLVSDGTNTRKMDEARQLGIKIVRIDWLIFCLRKRKHIDDESLLFN
ncbi:unnamed protein product [Blepharisma stoltei]|uniref:BRCT domain-containing protein n=1 Tax=Blepharisma stoltei TaxID=1481888 RepID=A0AAU9ILE7_9CILI|nr:unnamed protein product [Blepharisma stoltei]